MFASIRVPVRILVTTVILILVPQTFSSGKSRGETNACSDGGACPGCVVEPTRTCVRPDGNCIDQRNVP